MKTITIILLMGALVSFKSQFTNLEGVDITIQIGPDMGPEETDTLVCKGFTDETNNEQDPFDPIKARKATMIFRNEGIKSVTLFSKGQDNKFPVKITRSGDIINALSTRYIFEGFLLMDDNSELYVPPGGSFTLIATDNLGLLKNIELSDDDSDRLDGDFTIIQYLCWALNKTGLHRNIVVVDNLFEFNHQKRDPDHVNDGNKRGPLIQTYLNDLTFEKDVNTKQDCYTVLQYILKARKARLTYYGQKWWITRLAEYKGQKFSYTEYGSDATVVDQLIDFSLDKMIGNASTEATYFVNESTVVRLRRPFKSVLLKFLYEYPKEAIHNITFDRGDVDYIASTPEYVAYHLDDWIKITGIGKDGRPPVVTQIVYIRRIYGEDGFEAERYLVLVCPLTAESDEAIDSREIYVCEKGKFTWQIDYSWAADASGGGSLTMTIAIIRLEAYDGTHWTLDSDGKWYQSNETWSTFIKDIELIWTPDQVDETEWRTVSVSCEPIPRSGKLYVTLFHANQVAPGVDDQEVRLANHQLIYKPRINGNYYKYGGETHKVFQDLKYSATIDDQIKIADGPCRNFKGVMMWKDGDDNLQLTSKWNDWQMTHEGRVGLGDTRIMKWLTFDMWNQLREHLTQPAMTEGNGEGARIFEASLRGFQVATGDHCDLIHRYSNSVNSLHNKNKKFLMLGFRRDWYNCKWSALMAEVDDANDSERFDDDFEFKYIL